VIRALHHSLLARVLASALTLAAVTVSAGAEHADHAAICDVACGAQHVLQRVGRMRVVDDHGELLADRGAGELADAGAPTESGFEDCFRGGKETV